jgi:hypothetical protein
MKRDGSEKVENEIKEWYTEKLQTLPSTKKQAVRSILLDIKFLKEHGYESDSSEIIAKVIELRKLLEG